MEQAELMGSIVMAAVTLLCVQPKEGDRDRSKTNLT
jgi:hypothetical protein